MKPCHIVVTIDQAPEIEASIERGTSVSTGLDSAIIERVIDPTEVIRGLTATASVDDNYGVPGVAVTKTATDEHVNFDFAFSNLRGNGITSVELISSVGLDKTYRIETDSGDFYDMVLHDGNGIASTQFNANNTLTLYFTDGTSYTTPSLLPYMAVGTVETLMPNQAATASITGSTGSFILNLGIPKGNGVESIQKTGSSGNVDIYTITLTDGTTSQIEVTNANIDDTSTTSTSSTWSAAKLAEMFGSDSSVYSRTVQGWNSEPGLIADNGAIYIYSDASQYGGQNVPRIKVGDGVTYLIDLPFMDVEEYEHIRNSAIHVSAADRESWNNKVTVYDPQMELLTFTKD